MKGAGDAEVPTELDQLTIARAKRGEETAWRALIMMYQRPVWACIQRMLAGRDQPVVQDLAQDTFVRVFLHLPSFDVNGMAKLSTWILKIAARLAIDHLRRSRPTEPLNPERPLVSPEQTDRLTLRTEIYRAVIKAAESLSPEQRAVLVLCDFHEFTYEDIVDTLGIDLGTVKSRLSRARAIMRSALDGELR